MEFRVWGVDLFRTVGLKLLAGLGFRVGKRVFSKLGLAAWALGIHGSPRSVAKGQGLLIRSQV